MKIEIELPDWVEDKHLYVMAGIELVAYKYLEQPWKIKTSRCNACGKCCMNLKESVENTVDGTCIHLIKSGEQWLCNLNGLRPWSCCVVVRPRNRPECTEEFK